ncbi:Transcriptional regulatory protein sin3 [Pichia californica]|uniref:Transcriptional regulatory protein sin3 n=1 Tax=Pichia californica TaxID=460514 RepID=A0A9P7BH62_9ASCO|nr:Transcriptional regulatory protein sin3 [[Candida] californica]
MYQFPPLSNLNNLPRYSNGTNNVNNNNNINNNNNNNTNSNNNNNNNNINPGTTSLPSFMSISKGVSNVSPSPPPQQQQPPASQTNIILPSANHLLNSTSDLNNNKKLNIGNENSTKLEEPQKIPRIQSPVHEHTVGTNTAPTSSGTTNTVNTLNTVNAVNADTNINTAISTSTSNIITADAAPSSQSVTTPSATTPASSDEQKSSPNYKPLNVKDALYYLDQVKLQFRNQTDVYNNFLDIMKDFKSQKVSFLFKGHPKLIDGFNTFLPQGFSIECSTSDVNTIIVTTPMGTSIRRNSSSGTQPSASVLDADQTTNGNNDTTTANITENSASIMNQDDDKTKDFTQGDISTVNYQAPYVQQQQQQQQSQPQSQKPQKVSKAQKSQKTQKPQQQQTSQYSYVNNAEPQSLAPLQLQPQQQQKQPVPSQDQQAESKQSTPAEFDQAINYVNKIKQRYSSQPDIYKLFLENLQMYQKGLKPINEVYREISVLFRDAPDLLEDFKLFMPDNTVVKDVEQPEYSSYYSQNVQLPPVGNFQSAPYPNGHDLNNSIQQQQEQQFVQQQQQQYQQLQHDQMLNPNQIEPQQRNDQYSYPSQQYQQQQQYVQQQQQQQQLQQQQLQQQQLQQQQQFQQQQLPQPQQQQHKQQQAQKFQQDETRATKEKKKSSVSGPSQIQTIQKQGQLQPQDEFPVSNLRGAPLDYYQQKQDEKPVLISGVLEPVYPKTLDTDLSNELAFFDKVKKAISNKQTYNEFLKLLKLYSSDVINKSTLYDKAKTIIGGFPELFEWFKNFIGWEETPLRIENIAIKKQQVDLMMCKAAGPSYRQLPKSQTKMPCSGRDDLCWSIFNDEWVGHPVWASEESGFIAHRKNQYEEMLFRIEDERHEYDYYMEANLRTIQTLETIANRMANMTTEEKSRFKLPVGLGHTSSTIYVKVIRKVYDKDRGWEVIDALHENPSVTVPIVLKRLKQKDEEWKRAHREWNKVWREAEQKLMIKSLDHLGLSFKNIDKKLLTNKQLVSEISTIKQEQINKKLHPLMTRPKSELFTKYEDFTIFMDILKLVNTNLKHNQVYSQNDKERMETFMRSFMIKFFFMDAQFIDEELNKRGITSISEDKNDENDKEESDAKPILPTLSQTKKRPREYDLLKDVLRKNKRKRNDLQGQHQIQSSHSHNNEDMIDEEPISEEIQSAQANWISNETLNKDDHKPRDEYNMFSNTQIYVFYRHLDTLYKRLLDIKKISSTVNKEIKSRVPTKFAIDLGLIDNHLDDLDISIKGNDSYSEALELCVKLIDNKLEQSTFEEALRNGFRNKAFKLFTIDRVIQSLMKHCHTIVSDSKCSEILLLMEKDRNQLNTSMKDQILYRIQVRSYMNQDENMFKITYNKSLSTTTITFLALEDLTVNDDSQDKESKWNYYLTSYSMSHPTEGLDSSKIRLPFLKSQIDLAQDESNEVEGVEDSKLSVKVDVDSYRMRFEPESYDLFIRNSLYNKKSVGPKNKEIRVNKLAEVVEGDYGIASELKDGIKTANEKLDILKEKGPEEYLKFNSSINKDKQDKEDVVNAVTTEDLHNNINNNNSNNDDDDGEEKKITEPSKELESEVEQSKIVKDNEQSKEDADKSIINPILKEVVASEVTVLEGDSTIQQDDTVEKVDV